MSTPEPPSGDLRLVVGYDGSPPASRALDAAVNLLRGRTGRIQAVYVTHLPSLDALSAGAAAEMEVTFDEVEAELSTAVAEQLRGRAEGGLERRQGITSDQLIEVAKEIHEAHAGDTVVIVVGSSSHAMHRVIGSVAVSLSRHSPVPLVIVP